MNPGTGWIKQRRIHPHGPGANGKKEWGIHRMQDGSRQRRFGGRLQGRGGERRNIGWKITVRRDKRGEEGTCIRRTVGKK